ncbi:MAG: HAD family phosphatase [Nanoarchaeota archaeon]
MTIKIIIMDFGGVLATDAPNVFLEELAIKEDLDIEELVAVWREPFAKLLLGEISEDEFWLQFIDCIGIEKDIDELIKDYKAQIRSYIVWDKALLSYLKELREIKPSAKLRVVLVSNNVKEWIDDFTKKHNLLTYLEKTYFSFDMHLKKPDQEFFSRICLDLGVKPEECILVDNNQGTIQAAAKLGFKTHQYTDLDTFKRCIDETLQ